MDLRSRYAFSFPRRGDGEAKREIKKETDESDEVRNEAKEAEKDITLDMKEKEKETPRKHRPPPLDLDTVSSVWKKTQEQENQHGENAAAGVTISRPTTPPEALFTPKTAALVRAMEEGEEEEEWTTSLLTIKGHPVDDYHTSDSEGNQSDDIGGPTGLRKSMERRRIAR